MSRLKNIIIAIWKGYDIKLTYDNTANQGLLTIFGGTDEDPKILNNQIIYGFVILGVNNQEDIKKIKINGKIKVLGSASGMFSGLNQLTTIVGLENLDTSAVTNMSYMFAYCKNLISVIMGTEIQNQYMLASLDKLCALVISNTNILEKSNLSIFDT